MSVRLLLAVVVAAALIASSLPAIDAAQQARADQTLDESTQEIRDAVSLLVRHNDPVPPGIPGARRRVRIEVPAQTPEATLTLGSAGEGGHPADGNRTDVISSRIRGRDLKVTPIDADVRIVRDGSICSDGTGLRLHEDAIVTLSYVLVDGDPTVVATRGFKSPNPTTQSHVRFVR
jgi:hypothetical protein